MTFQNQIQPFFNVYTFCISDVQMYLFITGFFFSISKWCISLQFIWAIGKLVSWRRYLHLATFFLLLSFFFHLIFMELLCVRTPPSVLPQTSLSLPPSLNCVYLVSCRENERWARPRLAQPAVEQAQFHLHGPLQTSASLILCSLKPL